MGLRFLTADWIYPVSSPRIREGVVVMRDQEVVDIVSREAVSAENLEVFQGILIPGFVNTHCHLELSHLKGKAPTGTGLLPFLRHVVTLREVSQEIIDAAIEHADNEMWENGIQAVGDICNKPDTFPVKQKSPIRYYSFVEFFDFLQEERSAELTAVYDQTYRIAWGNFSAVPHAPYTVSAPLYHRIREMNGDEVTVSIHNQETQAEDDLLRNGNGEFLAFYESFGFSLDQFIPTHQSSLRSALLHLNPNNRNLFVHNTLTQPDDIEAAHLWSEHVFWATCPNANLYIENRLPHYQHFLDANAKMTIGTDSLTSNWQLSILEEMKTIAKYQSYVSFDTLMNWATLNGAEALGFEQALGSIEKGKTPGILCLSFRPEEQALFDHEVRARRII